MYLFLASSHNYALHLSKRALQGPEALSVLDEETNGTVEKFESLRAQ